MTRLEGNGEEPICRSHSSLSIFDLQFQNRHQRRTRSHRQSDWTWSSLLLWCSFTDELEFDRTWRCSSLFILSQNVLFCSKWVYMRQLVLAEFIHIRNRPAFARTHIPSILLITYQRHEKRLIPNHRLNLTTMKQFSGFQNLSGFVSEEHATCRKLCPSFARSLYFRCLMDAGTKTMITRHENGVSFENRAREKEDQIMNTHAHPHEKAIYIRLAKKEWKEFNNIWDCAVDRIHSPSDSFRPFSACVGKIREDCMKGHVVTAGNMCPMQITKGLEGPCTVLTCR